MTTALNAKRKPITEAKIKESDFTPLIKRCLEDPTFADAMVDNINIYLYQKNSVDYIKQLLELILPSENGLIPNFELDDKASKYLRQVLYDEIKPLIRFIEYKNVGNEYIVEIKKNPEGKGADYTISYKDDSTENIEITQTSALWQFVIPITDKLRELQKDHPSICSWYTVQEESFLAIIHNFNRDWVYLSKGFVVDEKYKLYKNYNLLIYCLNSFQRFIKYGKDGINGFFKVVSSYVTNFYQSLNTINEKDKKDIVEKLKNVKQILSSSAHVREILDPIKEGEEIKNTLEYGKDGINNFFKVVSSYVTNFYQSLNTINKKDKEDIVKELENVKQIVIKDYENFQDKLKNSIRVISELDKIQIEQIGTHYQYLIDKLGKIEDENILSTLKHLLKCEKILLEKSTNLERFHKKIVEELEKLQKLENGETSIYRYNNRTGFITDDDIVSPSLTAVKEILKPIKENEKIKETLDEDKKYCRETKVKYEEKVCLCMYKIYVQNILRKFDKGYPENTILLVNFPKIPGSKDYEILINKHLLEPLEKKINEQSKELQNKINKIILIHEERSIGLLPEHKKYFYEIDIMHKENKYSCELYYSDNVRNVYRQTYDREKRPQLDNFFAKYAARKFQGNENNGFEDLQ